MDNIIKAKTRSYIPPMLTVVTFRTEQGYSTSGGKFLAHEMLFTSDEEVIETRDASGGYFGGGNSESWF